MFFCTNAVRLALARMRVTPVRVKDAKGRWNSSPILAIATRRLGARPEQTSFSHVFPFSFAKKKHYGWPGVVSSSKSEATPFVDVAVRPHGQDATPVLVAVEGLTHPMRWVVPMGSSDIGCAASCDLSLEIPGLSRRHARLVRSGNGPIGVVDLGSTNGTFVNGQRVRAEHLFDGSRLQLANVVFEVRYEQDKAMLQEPLSQREWQIARLLANGLSAAAVSTCLGTAHTTVRAQIRTIHRKLNVSTRAQLVAWVFSVRSDDESS